MVPTRTVFFGQFPLTANGKLDRRAVAALLNRARQNLRPPRDAASSNDVEAALAKIVAEVLGTMRLACTTISSRVGGDSVLATTVIARVRDWLEADHAVVADLFATRTVAGCAERLNNREAHAARRTDWP